MYSDDIDIFQSFVKESSSSHKKTGREKLELLQKINNIKQSIMKAPFDNDEFKKSINTELQSLKDIVHKL
jgi:hypothetical protein